MINFPFDAKETIQRWKYFWSPDCNRKLGWVEIVRDHPDPLYPAFRCRGPRMTLNFKGDMRPVLPKKNDAWYSSCFFSKALPTHRFHPQFSRLQDAVCEKLAVSQSQCVICFRQPWSPGFGMHSRGGDGCCFWDDDYVLVLFCLDTVSYFGSIPKKTPLRRNTILTER